MAKKETEKKETEQVTPEQETVEAKETAAPDAVAEVQAKLDAQHDQYLRLAAEYDNFRKRTQKEKDSAYGNGQADTVSKILPVYDNLARALAQETADAAFKKGVEMTMTELRKILDSMGVTIYGEAGETFDPNLHNAVMHMEDENLGENVIAQVFQQGCRMGERVIRFAMVQVAN